MVPRLGRRYEFPAASSVTFSAFSYLLLQHQTTQSWNPWVLESEINKMKRLFLATATVLLISVGLMADGSKQNSKNDSKHATKKVTLNGWISDSECAAQGVKNCNSKEHVANGSKLVIVAETDGAVYTVTNPEKVADHQGEHVKVNGALDASSKELTVAKLATLK